MKGRIIVLLLLLVVGFSSCERGCDTSGMGRLSVEFSASDKLVVVTKGEPTTNDFKLTIFKNDGSEYQVYESYGDMPTVLEIPEGSYTMQAANGTMAQAAFDAPYYYGASDIFEIKLGELTEAHIVARMANTKVSFVFSDIFKQSMADYNVVVSNYNEQGALTFAKDDTRAGYFTPPTKERMKITIAGTTTEGKAVTHTEFLTGVKPCQWHKMTISVALSGSMQHEITVDTQMQEQQEDVEIPMN